MKNKIVKSLLGISAFALALNVNAATLDSVEEGSNASSHDVTVGSVDVPVYSVDIEWDPLKFNWKYDSETGIYNWVPEVYKECNLVPDWVKNDEVNWDENKYNVYTDSTCDTRISQDLTYSEVSDELENYYFNAVGYPENNIYINDNSTMGQIVPSVVWNAEDEYDFVNGKFIYEGTITRAYLVTLGADFNVALEGGFLYYDEELTQPVTDQTTEYEEGVYYLAGKSVMMKDLTTPEIPEDGRQFGYGGTGEWGAVSWYRVTLSLENDETKTITTPTAGDKIGSVTISIRARS